MKNKLLLFLITVLLSINTSAQNTDSDYMKKHQKELTYKIVKTTKKQKVTSSVDISFPKNYFSKKAQLEIVPIIKTNNREIKLSKIIYKGENSKKSGKIINFADGLNDNFSFSKDLNQNEKVISVKLEFIFWLDGADYNLHPLNVNNPKANTGVNIQNATIEDINKLIKKFDPKKDIDTLIALNEMLGEQ